MGVRERSILLVEDDVNDVELTRWAFEASGITAEMMVARDGVEALELLLPAAGQPALRPTMVLMDVQMPRMGGVETVRRIRAEPSIRTLAIVMLTCSVADRDILDSSDVGANGYAQKPLGSSDFQKMASVMGDFWLDIHCTVGTSGRPGSLRRSDGLGGY